MGKRGNYLAKNTFIFAIGNIGTKMINFFLVPIYTYALTTTEYGTVDLISTICMVLYPILILNINEAIMRFCLDKNVEYNEILSTGIVVFCGTLILGLTVIPISRLIPEISQYGIYLYFYSITLGGSQLLLCYLRGKEKLVAYTIGNIVHTGAIAVLNILFLLRFHWGITGNLLAFILSNIITMIYSYIVGNVNEIFSHFHLDKKLSLEMIKYSSILIPNTFMWWIINSSDRIMISLLIGASANGLYAIAYKIPTLLSTVTNVFTQAWSYSAIKENDSSDRDSFTNIVYSNLVSSVTIIGVGLLMIMKPFMKIYVNVDYYNAWYYTPYLVIGFVFLTIASFLSTSYTVNKDSKGFLISSSCGAIINIILNAILIPVFGVSGAALATCISYISVFIFRVFDTRKYVKIVILQKKHVIGYIILILSAFIIFIDSLIGQIILCGLFILLIFLNKSMILKWLKMIKTN